MEKSMPPPTTATAPPPRQRSRTRLILASLATLFALVLLAPALPLPSNLDPALYSIRGSHGKPAIHCPAQPEPLHPASTIEWSDDARARSTELFRAAVRIPTQSYDDNGEPGEDGRWAPFFKFQDWLKASFPTAWGKAKVEFVNTLGIVATFQGSDESLKPLLLMSHYDVVPVPESTYSRWTHPPFSADLDDGWVYGRGAADDKSLLVAQWEALTYLLESGWSPRRTVILTHGFDEEEVHARRGQGHIAPFLEQRYGKDGLLMVVDEGTGTVDDLYGGAFAIPATGEKGYLDIVIHVGTPGGHSSVPPRHTGIGVMAQIVSALEDHPFDKKLTPDNPVLSGMACFADHGKMPKKLRKMIRAGPKGWTKLAEVLAEESPMDRALVGTTVAVDVVNGGVKVNALPELVTAMVNFRIDFSESLASTKAHTEKLLKKVAEKNKLEFRAWAGANASHPVSGKFVTVDVLGAPLEPAPNTPTSGGVWDLFAGTVRAVMPAPGGGERIVAPFASTGNTDCKMYYNLTKNVYRFMGANVAGAANIHTVDEKFKADEHHKIVDWIHALVQNADAYDGEQ